MRGYLGYAKGFKSQDAAERHQMLRSEEPAYCALHPAFRGDIFVRDPIQHAGGRVHIAKYQARSVKGDVRTYWSSWVGA